jgi:uncharacterized protein DUF222/HNH endonuclease
MCSEGGERGNWTSQQVIGEIGRLLDLLGAEDVHVLPAESIGDDLKGLTRIGNRVAAESSRRLRCFDKGQGYASWMALSAQAWLRWQCNLTAATASEQVQVARQMDSLPQTEMAFSQGEISYRHAALIARTADQLGDKFDSQAETILVTAAKELDPWRLRRAAMFLRHCLEPDGVLADANEAHERRYLYLSQTFDGIFRLDGQLDADGGAALQTVLDALMGPPAADGNRTAPQRRADAMVDLAHRQLDGGELAQVGGQKPHLMVTVDMATLSKQPGSPAAELEWAQPIPAETARRIACDCTITPILRGAESHQVDVGRTRRSISPAKKRALVARDKGCRFEGCDRPPAWTDGHHIQHWADDGTDELANLVLLCRRHHYRFHEEGWRLWWGADGELVAAPP